MANVNRLTNLIQAYAEEHENTTPTWCGGPGDTVYDAHLFAAIRKRVAKIKAKLHAFRTQLASVLQDNKLALVGPPDILLNHESYEDLNGQIDVRLTIQFTWDINNGSYAYATLAATVCIVAVDGHPDEPGGMTVQISNVACCSSHGSLNKMCGARMAKSDGYYENALDFMQKNGVPKH